MLNRRSILRQGYEGQVKETKYIYSNENILQEITTDETTNITTTKNYINGIGLDDLVAYEENNDIYFYHKNHLGSVEGISDSSGNIVVSYEYDSFGNFEITSGTDNGNTRLYTGREFDKKINLYYLRARYYSAELGRFISRDPIDIADDVNLYAYVGNSPIMYTDILGLAKILIIGGADSKGEFKYTINYYKKLFLEQGVKEKNIIIIENVSSSQKFNEAVESYVGNIQEIVHINHGSNLETWNIGELNAINNNSCSNVKMTIIACNAGKGENSIGEQLSNQLGISTEAASGYISINKVEPIKTSLQYIINRDSSPTLIDFSNIKAIYENKEIPKWKNFIPNY